MVLEVTKVDRVPHRIARVDLTVHHAGSRWSAADIVGVGVGLVARDLTRKIFHPIS